MKKGARGFSAVNCGGAGLVLKDCKDVRIDGYYSRGNAGGDMIVDGVENLTVSNSDMEGGLPACSGGGSEKLPKKYFGGFSFSKGDHLKKD